MNGDRPNCLQAEMVYMARPLDGIWATAPFLHNGLVPTLWVLLSTVEERPRDFCLGSRIFNPKEVDCSTKCVAGAFRLDTTIDGNRNSGHVFKEGPLGNGVIGRTLDANERWVRSANLVGKKIVPAVSKVWRRPDEQWWGPSVRMKLSARPPQPGPDGPHGQCQAKTA